MEYSFYKMHIAGNDLILADLRGKPGISDELLSRCAIRSCRRRTGIGGTGIIYLLSGEGRAVLMRLFTSRGTESRLIPDAEFCVGKFLFDSGSFEKGQFVLETILGNAAIEAIDSSHFRIELGVPAEFEGGPPLRESPDREYSLFPLIDGKRYALTPVFLGSASGVVFTPDLEGERMRGKATVFAESRDERIRNLQPVFVSIYGRDEFRVVPKFPKAGRDHATAAARFRGRRPAGFLEREADAHCHGASFYLQWIQPSDKVYCTGMAEYAFYGTYYDEEEPDFEESGHGPDI
jgi:diaminopimelate epimerase